jgi:hypothetical protein
VTKLSLLLKVLEGETGQLSLGFERVLPDLGDNIQCGNSLIGPDYYEGKQLALFSEDELYRINAFDWEAAFPEVFAQGGFDAVIGNPPYVDIKSLSESDAHHLLSAYKNANNRINLFAIFIEKSLLILKQKNFYFSMIVPTSLLTQESFKELRKSVNLMYSVANITRLPNESFGKKAGDVKVDTVIIVITNKGHDNVEIISYSGYERIFKIIPENASIHRIHKIEDWIDNKEIIWSLTFGVISEEIISKCNQNSVDLEKCVDITLGITPYDKYRGHTKAQIKNKEFHSNYKKDDTFKPLLAGKDVRRYSIVWNGEQWISYGPWLGAPREERFFTTERILIKQIIDWTSKRIWASKTSEELYNTQNAFNLIAKKGWNINYLLGIINSKLITYFHRKKFLDEFKMRFQKVLIRDARKLPIHSIDNRNPSEIDSHNRIIILVGQMLDLTKKLINAQIPTEKTQLQRQIDATDAEIDRLVYDLYGLTEEEIRIVEESVG